VTTHSCGIHCREFLEVASGAEARRSSIEDDRADPGIAVANSKFLEQALDELGANGIAATGTIDRENGDWTVTRYV
jgi:hypothetical protein